MKIGIAITTRNRRPIFENTYKHWKKYAPENSSIVVIDDASDVPVSNATISFSHQQGIAKAKNACLDTLLHLGCDHLILADDDVYPLSSEGIMKYVNSPFNHMCMTFDRKVDGVRISHEVYRTLVHPKWHAYNAPCGCLMYFKKKCFDFVSGYDTNYKIWGKEHEDLSLQIHAAGLTPMPFLDIPYSTKYFYSHDYHMTAESSVDEAIRIKSIEDNTKYYKSKWE